MLMNLQISKICTRIKEHIEVAEAVRKYLQIILAKNKQTQHSVHLGAWLSKKNCCMVSQKLLYSIFTLNLICVFHFYISTIVYFWNKMKTWKKLAFYSGYPPHPLSDLFHKYWCKYKVGSILIFDTV